MRSAVDRIGVGKKRQINVRFLATASHYLSSTDFCNPGSGWEKQQVEKNVQEARRGLWQSMPCFATLADLNDWLERRCKALSAELTHGSQPGSIAHAWTSEAACLMPVGRPFDGFVEYGKRLSPTCLVHFDRNRYSASILCQPCRQRARLPGQHSRRR